MKNQTISIAQNLTLWSKVKSTIRSRMDQRNDLISQVIDEPVSNRQVVALANFSISFVCTIFAVSHPIALPLTLGWMVFGYQQMKKGGMTYEE